MFSPPKNVKFGEAAKVQVGWAFKSSYFQPIGIPIVRMSNLNSGKIDLNDAAKVSSKVVKSLGEFCLKDSDVLIGLSGSLSNFARVVKEDLPAYLNQRVGRLVITNKCNAYLDYLYYWIQSFNYLRQVELAASGVAQRNISPNQIHAFDVYLPIKSEQPSLSR